MLRVDVKVDVQGHVAGGEILNSDLLKRGTFSFHQMMPRTQKFIKYKYMI